MADLAVWQRTIVDEKGDIIPGAEVSVRSYPGGSLITLYEGPDGTQVKGNPFVTGSDGFARFWARSQRAEIVARGAGSTIRWIVDLINADEVIGGAVAEATAAAETAVGEAKDAADRAEAARDAAQLNARVFPTTSAGLAATSDGDYFSVPSPDDNEYLILYRNDSGSATEVRRYPSAEAVDRKTRVAVDLASQEALLPGDFYTGPAPEIHPAIVDERGNLLLGFDDEGQLAHSIGGEIRLVPTEEEVDQKTRVAVDLASEEALLAGEFFQSVAEAEVVARSIARDERGQPVLPFDERGQPILYLDADFYTEEADEVAGGIAVGNRIVLPWGRDGVPILPDPPPPPPVPEQTPVALLRRPDVVQAGDQLVCLEGVYSEIPHHLDVRWYRNGVQIPGAVSRRITIDETSAVYRFEEVATFSAARISSLSLPWAVNTSLSPDEQAERDAEADYRTGAADSSPLPPPALETGEFAAIDVASGQPLFLSNADDDIALASTSKIATCILLARWVDDLSEVVTVTEDQIPTFPGTLAGLEAGDTLTLDGLGYCLMLPSGNDAANVIADVVGGKIRKAEGLPSDNYADNMARFVQAMNDLATELGLTEFAFHNPSGGPGGSSSNRGTALAVAYLVAEASRHPVARKFMATKQQDVPVGGPNARTLNLVNTAAALMDDEGFVAGKTGSGGGGSSGIYASVWKMEGGSVALVVSNTDGNAARVPLTRELRDEVKAAFAWINGWAQPK